MTNLGYNPLQNITSYSLLQSTNTVPKLIEKARARGYDSVALTDRNVLYGAVAFYNEAKRQGIKPVIGLTVVLSGMFFKEEPSELVLIAKDHTGYQNLMKISSLLMDNEQTNLIEKIKNQFHHLFVIFPENSELRKLVETGRTDDARKLINDIKTVSDLNSVKIGVNLSLSKLLMSHIHDLAAELNVDLVALNSVEYLDASDYFPNEVLKAIGTGKVMDHPMEKQHQVGSKWLKYRHDVESQYHELGLDQAVLNNQKIVDAVNVDIPQEQPKLPSFTTPNQLTSKAYLRQLCEQGLKERQLDQPVYQNRLDRELSVINHMGFDDYFLIVWDVLNFAHRHGIITGPGRGSSAGSLVAYTLRITDVDPIKYNLLFERFLNEERAQMPDIDLDIPDDRRDDILQYVHHKYGNEHVAQIVTFGTLAAKQAIRDVGRVFGMTPIQMSQWSSAIPNQLHESLSKAESESQKLKNLLADQKVNQLLFDTAEKLEGLPRHFSTHAAGLILSEDSIVDRSPLQSGNDGLLMTQYSKYYVESVGLLKIDFLGLRNLSTMANILRIIHSEIDPKFKINEIDLNDQKTLKLFQAGKTDGVFQFESSGIQSVLRKLKPDNFDMVAAVNALYRPGPIKNIDMFIARKNGTQKVNYPNQTIRDILGSTFGIIVYQEQVMQLASAMGGFTLGQADILRRAMSKKHKKEMDDMKIQFIDGATKNGYPSDVSETTFDYIERFADYGFNKSHAVAYSKMAFQLAYLKVHFPGPFFASLLNSVLGNSRKIKNYVQEAKEFGIQVERPDINESMDDYTYQNGKIRFGFRAIKGLRTDFIKNIDDERSKNGDFHDLQELISRIDPRFRKVDLLNSLAYSGALDGFGYNRHELINAIPEFISSAELSGNSIELIQALAPKIKKMDDFSDWDKLNKENEYLGTYLTGHPVEHYAGLQKQIHALNTSDVHDPIKNVKMILFVSHVKTIRTKKGQLMAFIDGNDQFGDIDVTIFPNLYNKISGWLKSGMVVVIAGNIEVQRGLQLVANSIKPAANVVHNSEVKISGPKLYLKIDSDHDKSAIYQDIMRVIQDHPGNTRILIYRTADDRKQLLDKKYNVAINTSLMQDLWNILGDGNVVTQ